MNHISTIDLFKVQEVIIGVVRSEVQLARDEFRAQIADVKAAQQQHTARADGHARELARLEERTRRAAGSLFRTLTTKQKAALVSGAIAAGGAIVADVWHLVEKVAAVLAKGVHP